MEARRASLARVALALVLLVVASAAWLQPWRGLGGLRAAAVHSPAPADVNVLGAGFAGHLAWVAFGHPQARDWRLAETADAGQSWLVHPLPFAPEDSPVAVEQFGPELLAVTLGSGYLSPNLGLSWKRVQLPAGEAFAPGLTFLDANRGWYQTLDVDPQRGPQPSRMWTTADATAHWDELYDVSASDAGSSGLPIDGVKLRARFLNPLHGWMPVRNALYETGDGGLHWHPANLSTADQLLTPRPLNTGAGCADEGFEPSGAGLDVYLSPDCLVWQPAVAAASGWRPGMGADFLDLDRWAVAEGGRVRSTDNGGRTWREADVAVPAGDVIEYLGRFTDRWWALAAPARGEGPAALFGSPDGRTWRRLAVPGLA